MSAAMPTPLYTFDEYLAYEMRFPDVKWELHNGVIVAMAGGSVEHARAIARLVALLTPAADAHGCTVYGSDLRIRAADFRGYYADASVHCAGEEGHPQYLSQPCLVAEVLSPGTRVYDLGDKRAAYLAIATVRTYLAIDLDSQTVRAWRPGQELPTWHAAGETIELGCPPMTLNTSELFRR